MSQMIQAVNNWSGAWAGLMWAILWQSALVVGVIALVTVLLRRSSPAVRYWLWQIVAIKLLLMPFWTLAIPLPSWAGGSRTGRALIEEPPEDFRPASQGSNGPVDVEPVGTEPVEREAGGTSVPDSSPEAGLPSWGLAKITWQSWLLIGWSAMVVLQLVGLLWQRIRLGLLLRRALPADAELVSLVGGLARQLRLWRKPAVVLIGADCPLFVCGLRRPVLVLPDSLATSLDRRRLRQVVLHELAHVKRLDLLWSWPGEIARILYFFNPIVHWVCYRLRLEQELACDQLAMALGGGTPADYAETLIQVVDHDSQLAALKTPQGVFAGLDGHATAGSERKRRNKGS